MFGFIYKIPFKDSVKIDSIQEIPFFYPEQKDFEPKNINNDFDAEAMIFLNGKIHLFTKEWISKSVTHYTVNPNVFVQQPAEKIESFKINIEPFDRFESAIISIHLIISYVFSIIVQVNLNLSLLVQL